jgi:hypothetical protein
MNPLLNTQNIIMCFEGTDIYKNVYIRWNEEKPAIAQSTEIREINSNSCLGSNSYWFELKSIAYHWWISNIPPKHILILI